MVAISRYRGNLHKVPNVPRQWLMPARRISLKDFKILLRRRNRALSRIATPNPNSGHFHKNQANHSNLEEIGKIDFVGRELEAGELVEEQKDLILVEFGKIEGLKLGEEHKDGNLEEIGEVLEHKDGCEGKEFEGLKLVEENGDEVLEEIGRNDCEGKGLEAGELVEEGVEKEKGDGKGEMENVGSVEKLVEATESLVVEGKGGGEVNGAGGEIKASDLGCDNGVRVDQQVDVEIARKEEDASDKQKRRQEIEEKLKILNEKKHSLVQALKQILNVEEELKRRNDIEGVAGQPPVGGGQLEGTHDSGSFSRHNTPRMGFDGNVSGEAGGVETDDVNHNVHLRHLVGMSSRSPSSDTQQRKSTFITATLPSRTNSGVANSPSRFALAGHQGLPPHLPSVSVSGTNYVASSPSPAASGGTSAFRDGRGRSPCN